MNNILLFVINQTIIELYYYDKGMYNDGYFRDPFVNRKLYPDLEKKYV